MIRGASMKAAIQMVHDAMRVAALPIHTTRWQGVDISAKPEAAMMEMRYAGIHVPVVSENLEFYRQEIEPNLPWADDHFAERVCGEPINPGKEWANWPYGNSAQNFLDANGQFNHNYMERYWPKYAGMTPDGKAYDDQGQLLKTPRELGALAGIRHYYGDLGGVVELLAAEPLTRQAYLPIFFPEDTGVGDGGRKPCTLGYLFMMRNDRLDITYYIRSCDFVRHFRDDIYLTVRLLLWVLDRLREKDPRWDRVTPGVFRMDIGSLHMFVNDYHKMFGAPR